MKNAVLSSLALLGMCSAQFAFALDYVCTGKVHNRDIINVTVDEAKWDHAVVHRPNSGHHSFLSCEQSDVNEYVCESVVGDPNNGGGCGNPFTIERFTVNKSGHGTYHYVNNGFIFVSLDYECKKVLIDGKE